MVLDSATTGLLAGAAFALILALILWGIGVYVYTALAMQSIARKSGYPRPWFAWVPVLNIVQILELGNFHWAWVFLILGSAIPVVGTLATIALVVLTVISLWRVFEKAGYAGALSLLTLVPIARMIILGIVAWEKKSYKKATPIKKTVAKKTTSTKKKVAKKAPAKKKVARKKSTRKK
jgi:hypothetical protein